MVGTINERLKRVREELCGDNNTNFAAILGSSTQYASSIVKDGKNVGDKTLSKLLNAFPDLNPVWLKMGEGEMLKTDKPFRNEITAVPNSDYMMVEFVDLRASAGRLGGAVVEQLPETHRRLIPKEYDKGGFLVVRVDGDSMDDGTSRSLKDGDEILVYEKEDKNLDELPIRKTLFVITTREGNILKQIKEINKENGFILCHSFNPSYEDFKINFEDIYQIFIVCKVTQKQISLI